MSTPKQVELWVAIIHWNTESADPITAFTWAELNKRVARDVVANEYLGATHFDAALTTNIEDCLRTEQWEEAVDLFHEAIDHFYLYRYRLRYDADRLLRETYAQLINPVVEAP